MANEKKGSKGQGADDATSSTPDQGANGSGEPSGNVTPETPKEETAASRETRPEPAPPREEPVPVAASGPDPSPARDTNPPAEDNKLYTPPENEMETLASSEGSKFSYAGALKLLVIAVVMMGAGILIVQLLPDGDAPARTAAVEQVATGSGSGAGGTPPAQPPSNGGGASSGSGQSPAAATPMAPADDRSASGQTPKAGSGQQPPAASGQTAAAQPGQKAPPADLEARIRELETKLASTEDGRPNQISALLVGQAELQKSVKALERKMAAITGEEGAAAGGAQGGEADGRVGALVTSFSNLSERIDAIDQRLAGTDFQAANAEVNAKLTEVTGSLAAASDEIAQTVERLNALEASSNGTTSAIESVAGEVAAQSEALAALSEQLRATGAKLDQRLTAVEENTTAEQARSAVAGMAMSDLQRKVDNGATFESEIAALLSILPKDPALQQLRTFASKDLPSNEQLMGSFPTIATQISQQIGAARPRNPISSFFSLFTINKAGDPNGDDPRDLLVKAEEAIRDGKLYAAGEAISRIGADLRGEPARWVADVQDRQEIDRLMRDVSERVVKPLTLGATTRG